MNFNDARRFLLLLQERDTSTISPLPPSVQRALFRARRPFLLERTPARVL